jgi:hypothetical protein
MMLALPLRVQGGLWVNSRFLGVKKSIVCPNLGYRYMEQKEAYALTMTKLSWNSKTTNLNDGTDLDMDDNVGFLLGGPEYYREDKHFLDSITAGTPTKSDFKSALKVDFLTMTK